MPYRDEIEERRIRREENRRRRRKQERTRRMIVGGLAAVIGIAVIITAVLVTKKLTGRKQVDPADVAVPEYVNVNLLTPNEYSRPQIPLEKVNGIVVHYVANPCSTALENRNYFEGLKDQSGSKTVSASSHYIIGSDGTILQCIPLDEVAYGNYPRNDDTVSIECCHPDSDGRFTDATIKSLIRLTGWLCRELSLNEKHIIRHYDVSGKNCPKYYVEHQDAWRTLKKKLAAGIQQ